MKAFTAIATLALLGACSQQADAPAPEATESAVATPAPLPAPATPDAAQQAALDSKDCRTVVDAYVTAVAARDFTFAARFWDDPVVDDARLAALFDGYGAPTIAIAGVQEEGAAGSTYCTVTGALSDADDAAKPLREGEIVLRRVNDVPGATPQQLRFTIQSSTFVEKMERSGRGEPA